MAPPAVPCPSAVAIWFLQTEVGTLVAEVEKSGSKHIELQDFLNIMARKVSQAESPASCIRAFKVRWAASLPASLAL